MFSSKHVENKLVLILDIQSSVIRGSLTVMHPEVVPMVIFTYNAVIDYKSSTDSSQLIKATLHGISETIQAVLRHIHIQRSSKGIPEIPRKISAVHYVLSSPWIVSEAKVLSMQFDKDTEITEQYICNLIKDDREKMAPSSTEPLEVIEQKIFDVRLNGYSVSDWEHKTTRSLEVSFTVSVAGESMIACFIEECKHFIHSNKVQFHSSLLLQYIGIEKVHETGQDYCLIHIHGDETDVSIVRQKSCIYFGSYPFGVRTLILRIGTLTDNHRQAADSLLTLYTGEKLDEEHNEKNIKAINTAIGEWANALKMLLIESKVVIKPSASMILTAWAHDDCFVKILKQNNPGVSVFLLSIEDLLSHVSFGSSAEKRRLTALHTIAIHNLFT